MTELTLVSDDALLGKKIALSVSESADLPRLGLTELHCRLVVAEVGRAIMLAGGTVVYGGNLRAEGYTWILIEEAQRFSCGRHALEIVLAESEHRQLDEGTLIAADRSLGDVGRLTLLSRSGEVVSVSGARSGDLDYNPSKALTAMRNFVANYSNARLIVGGRLKGFAGAEPGVVEEARLTIQAGRPLLVAGGYGGAAAAVARRLRPRDFDSWAPEDYPVHAQDDVVRAALDALEEAFQKARPDMNFNAALLRTLTISHRPADIATSTVRLLSGLAP